MIVENNYKINVKTGDICTKQRIEVLCDRCGKKWKTSFGVYKRRKLKKDYCISCRNSLGICGVKGGHSKKTKDHWKNNGLKGANFIESKCSFCNKDIKIRKEYKKDNNCCSIFCRAEFDLQKRYSHLEDLFRVDNDAVSYLIGAIMGDGNISKCSERTSRISIANNSNDVKLLDILKMTCDSLRIKYSILDRKNMNVKILTFTLPDYLLRNYSIDYYGSKYSAQPYPSSSIIGNINFLAGMINTDGYCAKRKSGGTYVQITNTVKSIIKACEECLESNGYNYRTQPYISKNKRWKKRYDIFIHGTEQVNRLRKEMSYQIKDARLIK